MQVTALEGHRIWSRSYDAAPNPLLALETRVLPQWLQPREGQRFIDVACGTGRWMTYARARGAQVAGIDLCHEMLLQGAPKPGLAGRLARGSAECLPVAGAAADLALCSFALGYMANARGVFRELARVCRRGGRVVVSDLHPEALAAGWKRAFRSGVDAYELEHFSHPTAGLLEFAAAAGLRLEHTAAASFGEPERAIFRRGGKEHLFEQASQVPAIWIGVWARP